MMHDDLLSRLKKAPWYYNQIAHAEVIPPSSAEFANTSLHPVLQAYLSENGLDDLQLSESVLLEKADHLGSTVECGFPVEEVLLLALLIQQAQRTFLVHEADHENPIGHSK